MGTTVSITVISDSPARAEDALAAAYGEMDRLIRIFDRHQPGTAMSQLNDAGRISLVDPEMIEVLEQARSAYQVSEGAFDPRSCPC